MVHVCIVPERDGKCHRFGRCFWVSYMWVRQFVNDLVNEKGLDLFKCFQQYETGNC